MRQLLINYTLLVIITTLVARLTASVIMFEFPKILIQSNSDGGTTVFPVAFIETALEFVMIFHAKDAKQNPQRGLSHNYY